MTGRLTPDASLSVQLPGYADPVAVWIMSGGELVGVFSILRCGGEGGWIGLSILADINHNCMKRCDSREMCMASLSIYPGELAEECGG